MKNFVRPLSLAFLGLALLASPSYGKSRHTTKKQTAAPQATATQPPADMLDISAEESLEYYQDQKLYVARGKAKAIRRDMTVEADLLTAHQRDTKTDDTASPKTSNKASGDIDQMTAEGNVHIYDAKQQVFGQKAVYNIDQKTIKVTGTNLKYVTEKDIVTAKDSLEYFDDKKIAVARGRAMGEHQGSRVEADTLIAQFGQNASGQMDMTELNAKGNVIIVTKDGGVSRGDVAVYDTQKNIAVLTHNVRITRGQTQLAGDKAEVDFATGQSRLINSGSGRVRALLPSSGEKQEKTAP